MAERKFTWCDYEVVDGSRGRYIEENASWRGYGPSNVMAGKGIEFPLRGKDANLWLLRDGQAKLLALRQGNQISATGFSMVFLQSDPAGIHITWDNGLLQNGDGFTILPPGVRCEPGPIDTQEGRPRPTVYLER